MSRFFWELVQSALIGLAFGAFCCAVAIYGGAL